MYNISHGRHALISGFVERRSSILNIQFIDDHDLAIDDTMLISNIMCSDIFALFYSYLPQSMSRPSIIIINLSSLPGYCL